MRVMDSITSLPVSGSDGNTVTMHSGNTFRFRLDGTRIEHYTHGQVNPYGMSYDVRGDLLTADCHTKPVTLLLHGGFYQSFGKPHDGLGFVPNVMDHLHGSTAIGGIAIAHAGNGWPADFQNNTFGGNVMTSRINRNSLRYDASSVRAQEEPDFLISGDSWFRPVDLQMGPDGALYVADFYNRIIGHYEVPLNHPGRDRHRGRIWKISYTGKTTESDERTAISEPLRSTNVSERSPDQLVTSFASPVHTLRMLAMDRLVDEFQASAIPAARRGLGSKSDQVRLHCMWSLARLHALNAAELQNALRDPSSQVRCHAQRLLGFNRLPLDLPHDLHMGWIMEGLKDSDPVVCRAAASTCHSVQSVKLVTALLECHDMAEEADVHLRHAVRIGLKHQLADAKTLEMAIEDLDDQHVPLIADVCLAVQNSAAADFLTSKIHKLFGREAPQVLRYVQHASRYISPDMIPKFIELVRADFSQDVKLQYELIRSIGDSFRRRGLSMPPTMEVWASDLANNWLAASDTPTAFSWQSLPHPAHGAGRRDGRATWTVSNARNSADGQKQSTLWSSFPHGEQRTGVFRSAAFPLGESFGFYIAGHDGYPNQDLQSNNLVRLRDSLTHKVIQSWSPPRQDVAVSRSWETGKHSDRRVYVELIDGDTAGAYAWMAVGRFTEPRLNPSQLFQDRERACQLVTEFQLQSLRKDLSELLVQSTDDVRTRTLLANTVASLRPESLGGAIAASLHIAALPEDLLQSAVTLLTDEPAEVVAVSKYLSAALKYASSPEQQRIAESLAADGHGLNVLLELAESTAIDARSLTQPAIQTKIDALARPEQLAKISSLTAALPSEAAAVGAAIQKQKAHFLRGSGNYDAGRELFQKQCAICHQVAGTGKQVGPNLDGIGNRGVDRLLEDILAPNRNIDIAFRASTVVTDDGLAITGLDRGTDGGVLNLVDSQGKLHTIPTSQIEMKKSTSFSPMPANFADVLNQDALSDLLSYLLTLN